jgi:hypothetical protein
MREHSECAKFRPFLYHDAKMEKTTSRNPGRKPMGEAIPFEKLSKFSYKRLEPQSQSNDSDRARYVSERSTKKLAKHQRGLKVVIIVIHSTANFL